MKGSAAFLSVLVLLTAIATPSLAFNGQRRGFLLGFGIGPGYTNLSTDLALSYPSAPRDTTLHASDGRATLATDFRIGFGVSDRLLVYYDNRVSWYSISGGLGIDGISSVAASYYLHDTHPSLYLTGGLGSAAVRTFDYDGGTSGNSGFGFFGGVGYEMTQRFGLEGTVTYGSPTDERTGYKVTTTCVSFRAHLTVLWY